MSGSVGDKSPGYPSEVAFDLKSDRVRTCTADNRQPAVSNELHVGCLCVLGGRVLFCFFPHIHTPVSLLSL